MHRLIIGYCLSLLFLPQVASGSPLRLKASDLPNYLYIGGPKRLACSIAQKRLGALSSRKLKAGARFSRINPKRERASIRSQIKKLKARLKTAGSRHLPKLKRQLNRQKRRLEFLKTALELCAKAHAETKKPPSSQSDSSSSVFSFSPSSQGSTSSVFSDFSSFSSLPPSDCLTIEICGNGKDDNCDGSIDETPCHAPLSKITNSSGAAGQAAEYWAAGTVVDSVDFGYLHWSAASGDIYDPDGDLNDLDNSFGEHGGTAHGPMGAWSMSNPVSWEFDIPAAGYYVVSLFSWSSDTRRIRFSYLEGSQEIVLPQTDKSIDMYLLYFPSPGKRTFNASKAPSSGMIYLFHSRLFEIRQDPAAIMTARPRLGMEDGTLQQFRERVNRGWIVPMKNAVVSRANHYVANQALSYFSDPGICDPRGTDNALSNLGVGYLITGDSAILNYTVSALEGVASRPTWHCGPTWSYLGDGEYAAGVSVAYDAIASQLSEEQRKAIVRAADRHLNFTFISSIHAEHRGDGSHWWSAPSSNNWSSVINAGGLGTAAFAFESDNRYAEQWFKQAVKTQRWFFDFGFDADGAYQESMMYNDYALSSAALFMYGARFKGADFLSYRDGILFKNVYTSLYMMEPDKWNQVSFDDGSRWGLPAAPTYAVYRYAGPPQGQWFLAAGLGNDGTIQHFISQVYGDLASPRRFHNYAGFLPRALLLYREVNEIPAAQWQLPRSKAWPEFGRAVLRSGFDNSGDYMLAIQSGVYGSHGQADQSSFIIHALGRLLVDDNNYGKPETAYQNALLIDGLGQKLESDVDFGGSIDSFLHSNKVDYVLANSTQGYVKNGVDINSNLRHALMVAPSSEQDGYFIIADQVRSSAPHTYEWGMHRQKNGHNIIISSPLSAAFEGFDYCPGYPLCLPIANLEIKFASPAYGELQQSGDKLSLMSPVPAANENFTALLYPTDAEHSLPAVTTINTAQVSGFRLGNDLVLINKGTGAFTYDGLGTTGQAAFYRSSAGNAVLAMFNGSQIQKAGLGCSTSIISNCVINRQGNDYIINAGNDINTTTGFNLTVSGLGAGSYRCSINGTDCGILTVTGSELSFALPPGAYEIRLIPL